LNERQIGLALSLVDGIIEGISSNDGECCDNDDCSGNDANFYNRYNYCDLRLFVYLFVSV
jgi:hypothetical protein